MVIEVACVCVTVITLASLHFARKMDPVGSGQLAATYAERRRVLERDRAEWATNLTSSEVARRTVATTKLAEIDSALIRLAEEEARRW